MSTKTNTPFILALICTFALWPTGAFAAKGPPPTIRKMDIQTPFKHVYPGNTVVITMHATGAAAVSMVNLRLHASPYIGGRNELMHPSVVLKATGIGDGTAQRRRTPICCTADDRMKRRPGGNPIGVTPNVEINCALFAGPRSWPFLRTEKVEATQAAGSQVLGAGSGPRLVPVSDP